MSEEFTIESGPDTGEIDRKISEMYLQGRTYPEIGKVMGLSSGTVGQRLGKLFKSGELPRKPRSR
jgi:DNA-binding Lrp family transcriptional regulator